MRPSRPVRPAHALALGLASSIVLSACADSAGEGAVTVFVEPEASITDGVAAGSAAEDIVDGWSVGFTKYLVSIGDVRIGRSSDGAERSFPATHVMDLAALPPTGVNLVEEPSLPAGRWDRFEYGLVVPTAGAVVAAGVDAADVTAMIAGGCTYLIEGTLTNPTGQSCPPNGACVAATSLAFRLCAPATVTYTDCAPSGGLPGLVVAGGSSATVAVTFHGDHLFFSSFPGGHEIVSRRGQWLADADVNADGTVDATDLLALDTPTELSLLFPSASYDLANAPGGAITTAFDFAVAQLRTQGHFQGEGECAFAVP